MTLGELYQLYGNGVLNVKFEGTDPEYGVLGGVKINKQQASVMCQNFGWTEYVLSPFEIISKTAKFIRAFKDIENMNALMGLTVTFQNKRSSQYGKTMDRIHIESTSSYDGVNISVIYGMPNNGSSYKIYDGKTSVPLKSGRNMKDVVKYINTLI